MTDKVQKIHEEVERIINRRLNLLYGDYYFDLNKETEGLTNEIIDTIDSLQEEPVSEDLEVEVDRWYNNEAPKEFEDVLYADIEKCAKHFADWQKQQDQSTIELAEDHAMLAGMEKMKEQMMAKAVDALVHTFDNGYIRVGTQLLANNEYGLKVGDKVKVIIIKED